MLSQNICWLRVYLLNSSVLDNLQCNIYISGCFLSPLLRKPIRAFWQAQHSRQIQLSRSYRLDNKNSKVCLPRTGIHLSLFGLETEALSKHWQAGIFRHKKINASLCSPWAATASLTKTPPPCHTHSHCLLPSNALSIGISDSCSQFCFN
jgi:hypothetical protein